MDQFPKLKSILVSNTRPYSGSNSIAADIARIIAVNGKSVVVIDADMRHPYMHKVFGISNHCGLWDLICGRQPKAEVIQCNKNSNVSVITAGNLPDKQTNPLNSIQMQELIVELGSNFEKIIIHGPAFCYLEASSLAGKVDGLVLLIHPGHIKTQMYQSMVDKFQKNGTRITGIVMRDQPKHDTGQSAFIDRLLTFDRQVQHSA